MPLITDGPDDLNQGALTNAGAVTMTVPGTGADATITSASTMPALAAGEFFEMRDWTTADNDGLYVVVTVNTSTSSYEVDKITGVAAASDGPDAVRFFGSTGATTEKSVHLDTNTKLFYLIEQGNLIYADGATQLAIHSFFKARWKDDQDLMDRAEFPMVGISFAAGQWIYGQDPSGNNSGWKPAEDDVTNGIYTRRAIRNAGWDEIDANGVTQKKFFNSTTLGTFEDTVNDTGYFRFGSDATDTGAAVDYIFAGPVNEAVEYFTEIGDLTGDTPSFATTSTITRATGSFITDGFIVGGQVTINGSTSNNGTFVLTGVAATTLTVTGTPLTVEAWGTSRIAVDNGNEFTTYLRVRDADPSGKTYGQADLASAGETGISSKIIKFPLSNATDTNIAETDVNIAANSPYTEIRARYLTAAYNREVDTTTKRAFGIVVDVGTYSRDNGASATTTLFSSANHTLGAGEALADYAGGSLIIHEGTDQGTHTISGTPADNAGTLEITLTAALTATESNLSFTMQRATPIVATKLMR